MEKIKDIRAKSNEELKGMLQDLKKESLNLRFQQSNGALANTARREHVRRTIARIETVLAGRADEAQQKKETK